MSFALSDGIIKKTKKDHRCYGCDSIIAEGSVGYFWAGPDDNGSFCRTYFCITCFITSELFNLLSNDEEWCAGEFREVAGERWVQVYKKLLKVYQKAEERMSETIGQEKSMTEEIEAIESELKEELGHHEGKPLDELFKHVAGYVFKKVRAARRPPF